MSVTRQWRANLDVATSRRMNTKSLASVSATVDIANAKGLGPYTGQVIYNLTDGMLYRYDGTNWIACDATGGGFVIVGNDSPPKSHEARYFATAAQSIPNATDTKIQFPSVFANSSNDVTPSGTGNTDFLLNRDGVWHISAGVRYLGAAGGVESHLFLQTGTSFDVTKRFGFATDGNIGTGTVSLSTSSTLRAAAGTSVFAAAFQNSGGAVNTDAFASTVHGNINICLVWLRPL